MQSSSDQQPRVKPARSEKHILQYCIKITIITSQLLLFPLSGRIYHWIVILRVDCFSVAILAVHEVTICWHQSGRFELAVCRSHSLSSLGTDVGRVVEMKKQDHHRPGVIEGYRVVQVWIVTVSAHELVVGRVTDDSNKLDLQNWQ